MRLCRVRHILHRAHHGLDQPKHRYAAVKEGMHSHLVRGIQCRRRGAAKRKCASCQRQKREHLSIRLGKGQLADLAKILGVSIDELLTGKKEESTVKMLPKNEIKDIKDMMLRITITDNSGDITRINLPLGIIELAINSGLNISQVSGCDSLKSLNLSAIMESIRHGAIGTLMEIETADGETVKIFVE